MLRLRLTKKENFTLATIGSLNERTSPFNWVPITLWTLRSRLLRVSTPQLALAPPVRTTRDILTRRWITYLDAMATRILENLPLNASLKLVKGTQQIAPYALNSPLSQTNSPRRSSASSDPTTYLSVPFSPLGLSSRISYVHPVPTIERRANWQTARFVLWWKMGTVLRWTLSTK